jgi:hypothetical protein
MTGANATAAAIGQPQAAGSAASSRQRAQVATESPATSAIAAAARGVAIPAIAAKSGPLNRILATTFGMAPTGISDPEMKGR